MWDLIDDSCHSSDESYQLCKIPSEFSRVGLQLKGHRQLRSSRCFHVMHALPSSTPHPRTTCEQNVKAAEQTVQIADKAQI